MSVYFDLYDSRCDASDQNTHMHSFHHSSGPGFSSVTWRAAQLQQKTITPVTVPMTPLSLAAHTVSEATFKTILHSILYQQRYDPDAYEPILLNALLCAMRPATAVWNRNIFSTLQTVVNKNARAVGPDGWTPLHFAILLDAQSAVRFLFADTTLDPNIEDFNSQSPLSMALLLERDATVHMLLTHKMHKTSSTEILCAMLSGRQDCCDSLLDTYRDGLLGKNSEGYTLLDGLLWSAMNLRPEPYTNFKGSFIQIRDLITKNSRAFDLFNNLIRDRAAHDQPYQGTLGSETLNLAIATRSTDIFEAVSEIYPRGSLCSDESGSTALMTAVRCQSEVLVAYSLKNTSQLDGATNINAIDEDGFTALTRTVSEIADNSHVEDNVSIQIRICGLLLNHSHFDPDQLSIPPAGRLLTVSPLMWMAICMFGSKSMFSLDSALKSPAPFIEMLDIIRGRLTESEFLACVFDQKDRLGQSLLEYLCEMHLVYIGGSGLDGTPLLTSTPRPAT